MNQSSINTSVLVRDVQHLLTEEKEDLRSPGKVNKLF